MAKQYEMARLDEAREGAVVQVVDAAIAPEHKSAPRRTVIGVVASIVGFVAALAAILIRTAMRNWKAEPTSADKLARLRASFRLGR
jgi:uncharacterized protein involved in exopolysaccharide biosynthesis